MGTSIGLGSLAVQSSALQGGQDRVIQQVTSPQTASDDAKIDKGSQQFAAVLVNSWLQEAEESFATVPGADEDKDPGGEQMMSFGIQSLSNSLAAQGAFGIGKMIAQAMHNTVDKEKAHPAAVAGPVHLKSHHGK
jgi:Rod binding domain-containing protein